jgi:hypothetical protein
VQAEIVRLLSQSNRMPKKVIDVLFGWEGWLRKYASFTIGMLPPFCLMGRIWREGDNRTFGAVKLSITELKSSCKIVV